MCVCVLRALLSAPLVVPATARLGLVTSLSTRLDVLQCCELRGDRAWDGRQAGIVCTVVVVESPPLEYILGTSRMYFTCVPPRILGIPRCPGIDLYLVMLQQIHCIPLYSTISRVSVSVSSSTRIRIRIVSSCICCIGIGFTPLPLTTLTFN